MHVWNTFMSPCAEEYIQYVLYNNYEVAIKLHIIDLYCKCEISIYYLQRTLPFLT